MTRCSSSALRTTSLSRPPPRSPGTVVMADTSAIGIVLVWLVLVLLLVVLLVVVVVIVLLLLFRLSFGWVHSLFL